MSFYSWDTHFVFIRGLFVGDTHFQCVTKESVTLGTHFIRGFGIRGRYSWDTHFAPLHKGLRFPVFVGTPTLRVPWDGLSVMVPWDTHSYLLLEGPV